MSRKNKDQLDIVVAQQILQNVFEACEEEPNTVPLETLIAYSNYRKERYAMPRTIITVMLCLFVLLPVLFIASRINVQLRSNEHNGNPVYDVSVSTNIPVEQIQATIDGKSVPIYEEDSHEYTMYPGANGTMVVEVTLANKQITTEEIQVISVDKTQPVLNDMKMDDETVYLFVSDEGSGVDYTATRVITESGETLLTHAYDEEAGSITVPYPTEPLNVYISDRNGNELHILLKPQ